MSAKTVDTSNFNINMVALSALPNQTMKVRITIDNSKKAYYLFFSYREICEYWTMDLMDTYKNPILSNIPLVTGGGLLEAGNLLKQFGYKRLGSILIYKATETDNDTPDTEDLGSDFLFLWGDTI